MPNSTMTSAFKLLSIEATLFSALSALFGVYFVLFVLAIWATYRQSSKANTRLRIITLLLFVDLCVHYAMRSFTLSQARSLNSSGLRLPGWYVPTIFVACITTTIAGLISDGLLAWRLYVIYGRKQWAFWLPTSWVILTACFVSGLQNLDAYRSVSSYLNHYEEVSFQINAAWGWIVFATNTVMTGSIIGRIIYVTRKARAKDSAKMKFGPYSKLLEAIIESALVTWFGLVFYGIATVAPQGHITVNMDIGFVMICIVPIFFGISQCLITVRLGLASPPSPERSANGSMQDAGAGGSKGVVVSIQRTVTIDSASGHPSDEKHCGLIAESDSEQLSVTEVETV